MTYAQKSTYLDSLIEIEDTEGLETLSAGLQEILDVSEHVLPDTSFLFNGFMSYDEGELGFIRIKGNVTNLFSLLNFYNSCVDNIGNIKWEKVDRAHDLIRKSLSRSRKSIRAMYNLLDEGILKMPAITYDESVSNGTNFVRSLGVLVKLYEIVRDRGESEKFPKRKNPEKVRRSIMKLFKDQEEQVMEVINETVDLTGKVTQMAYLADEQENVIMHSLEFDDSDKKIIDSAMESDNPVGIVTCDWKFFEKLPEVMKIRKSSGLSLPPEKSLLASHPTLNGYTIKRY
jgi:hypothetical protein